MLSCFSRIQVFATLWTVVCQAICPWDSPGENTGVDCHALLQGDLPNPGIEPISLVSPALAGGFFFTPSATWNAIPLNPLL